MNSIDADLNGKDNFDIEQDFQEINPNFQICNSLFQPSSIPFSVIIGNPPYGNLIEKSQKQLLHKQFTCRTSEISELFIEKGLTLLNDSTIATLTFILPKTIAYYQNWRIVRQLLLQNRIFQVVNLGFAFENVNLEQIAILLQYTQKFEELDSSSTFLISDAIPLNNVEKEKIIVQGSIPLNICRQNQILLFTPLGAFDLELISKIQTHSNFLFEKFNNQQFERFSQALTRSIHIPDQQKNQFKKGEPTIFE